MPDQTVAQAIAGAVEARLNCERTRATNPSHAEWFYKWTDEIAYRERNDLPSGSGIDSGTTISLDRSTGTKLVLFTSYHHTNENGYYDGWTEHVVTVRPTFSGISVSVSGRDRNQIKSYLADTFHEALTHIATEY